MNSIIICEGSTDSILLQYFLRKAYGWEDTKERIPLSNKFKTFRKLKKEEKTLCIGGSGGVSQIKDKFDNILELNSFAANGEEYDKIMDLGLKIPASCTGTDEDANLADGFDTPLTLFTKNGKVIDCISGYVNKDTLLTKLETVGMIESED